MDKSAPVVVTVFDPVKVGATSFSLTGAPGQSVSFSTSFSGGRAPYTVTSDLGATVTVGNGTLSYQYTIAAGASGTLTDTVTVSGITTNCGGDSAKITVAINVLPALAITPSALNLQGAPGQALNASLALSGGTAPYTPSTDLGAVTQTNGTLNWSYTIPTTAAGTLTGTLAVRDANGVEVLVPVTVEVTSALAVAPTTLNLQGAPGQALNASLALSGGTAPYTPSTDLGAVTQTNGTLNWSYTIPTTAAGTLTGTLTVRDANQESVAVPVKIEVTSPFTVNPSPLELTALSSVDVSTTAEKSFDVTGGLPPYTLSVVSGGSGTVNPTQLIVPGAATYSVLIPANASADTTIEDTILITDSAGVSVRLPVKVNISASNPLSGRPDLTENERSVARTIETVCPQLAKMTKLTADQQDLLTQCTNMLQNASSSGIPNTLSQVTSEKARASTRAAVETGIQQLANVGSRLAALRRGSQGIDLAGLNFNLNGERISGAQLNSALQSQLTGGAASSDDASTFGNWGFFLTGTFNFGDKDRTANESGFDFDSIAITGGADYRFSDNFIAGAALGYAQNDIEFASDGGRLDTDTWHLATYATYYLSERTYLDAIVEYGWQDHDSNRNVAYQISSSLDPVRRQAKASYDGNQFGASLGAGYDIDQGPLSYGVYGRVGYLQVDVDGFRERGAGGLNLEVDGFDATSVTTTLGARVSRVFNTTKAVIVPQARVEWEHEYDDDASLLVARFAADPNRTSFDIRSDSPDPDYFRIGLGVSALFPQGLSAFVNYNTLIDKRDMTHHLIDLGMRWEFY